MILKKLYNHGILESDSDYIATKNISGDEINKQLKILLEESEPLAVKEPATFENKGIKSLNIELFSSALKNFTKNINLVNIIPAAGAASRQFQLLKTIYFNPNFKYCETLDEILKINEELLQSSNDDSVHLFKEIKNSLESFWNGIVDERFAFISDLKKVLEENKVDFKELLLEKKIKTIIKYTIEPCGLNYKNLPKALLKFHSYKEDKDRLALEEHIRLCILTNRDNEKAKIHFIISEEHTDPFLKALKEIKEEKSFINFCKQNKFNQSNLEVTHSYQEKSTDTISLDKNSNKVARDENGNILLRKSGHGALLSNLNKINASGFWLQNIDNILYDNPNITKLSVIYKRLMAGIAFELKNKRDLLLEQLRIKANAEKVIHDSITFLTENFGIQVECTSNDHEEVIESLILIIDRPIIIGGYVPLKPGQKGGGPFIIPEELNALKIFKVNTVEGGEFLDGQDNPIFSKAKFFNPVNFFILKTKADGSYYDLNECLDQKRYFVSTKSDLQGNPIKALERPGLWNGSISKALQVSIPIPENLFSAVKTVSGSESFLSPLHQENNFEAFTESDYKNGVVDKEIAEFCKNFKF